MTWSIVARDAQTGRLGIAVATCAFAVGARVPHIRSNVGAIATQAHTNPYFGSRGLALLAAGATASHAVRMLLAADEGRDHRQLHVLDTHGDSAAATGEKCIPWCGHLIRQGFSVAGNMLAGPQVIEATAETFAQNDDLPFARRLLTAMHAGEAAGGDKRGRQSAALLIHGDDDFALLDLRVDDHKTPLDELSRLEAVARQRFVHYRRYSPTRDNPAGIFERDALEAAIARSIEEDYE
ncbi:MAG: DUF1028 domain-containing protein [Hyphomicrobiaceae bacterium]